MNVDFAALEEALESGSVESRQAFWRLAGVRASQRPAVVQGLFPEHRTALSLLPNCDIASAAQYAAKLDPEKVREIRRLATEEGWSSNAIAFDFGVGRSTVVEILTGKTWKHV